MKKEVLLATLCVLFAGSSAIGDDIWPPYWLGEERTVYAHWDTWQGDPGYIPPDLWSTNPPLPDVPFGVLSAGSVLGDFAGRTGVVELTDDFGVQFWLPNYDENLMKLVQIQVTYWLDQDWNPQVYPAWYLPGGETVTAASLEDYYLHADGWITDLWSLTIEPNPQEEWFALFARDLATGSIPWYPTYIDQVVIDTWCVPEPTTLVLLVVGGMCLASCGRRRRK